VTSLRAGSAALPVVLAALAIALVGCSTPEPSSKPVASASASASPAPVFASEEEALAAATEAYERYLEVSDEIANAGWSDSSGLDDVLTGQALEEERQAASDSASRELKQVGSTAYNSLVVEQVVPATKGTPATRVSAYVCLDVSGLSVISADGTSVVAPDRPDEYPLELVFVQSADAPTLLLEESRSWSGQNFC